MDAKVKNLSCDKQLHGVMVKDALANARRTLSKSKENYSMLMKDIVKDISLVERTVMYSLLNTRFDAEAKMINQRHQKKLFNLWHQQAKLAPDCITVIGDITLSVHERNALQFGLKHHILAKSFDTDRVKAEIESTVDSAVWKTNTKVDFDFRDDVKRCFFDFEKKSKLIIQSKRNVALHRTLIRLSRNKDICICPYDKGNGLVVLPRSDYYEKLDVILEDTTKFTKIDVDHSVPKAHPIVSKERSVGYYIRTYLMCSCEDECDCDNKEFKKMIPSGTGPGKLYGLCKVHKENKAMRPVVSMVNTPEYSLAKYLDSFIKPNIPSQFMINSTADFVSEINSYPLQGNEFLVSYDVSSLFTNVPLQETINLVLEYVYSEHSLAKPPFSKKVFKSMLLLCSQSYFMYKDHLYQQIDGVGMGSPLAPSLANMFLANLENRLLNAKFTTATRLSQTHPNLYLRYVDDIVAVFEDEANAELFLDVLNNLHPSIQFTMEVGNKSLAFLDVNICIDCSTLSTNVYRKPTHTGLFLNYHAVAPLAWKKGLIMCLLHRAKLICSSPLILSSEINNLKKMFMNNCYPAHFFDKIVENFMTRDNKSGSTLSTGNTLLTSSSDDDDDLPCVILNVPFYGRCSEIFAKKLTSILQSKFDVKVKVIYCTFKVKSYFRLKCSTPRYLLSNVVYHFNCMNASCSDDYIGYTTRHLYIRCGKEHLNLKSSGKSEIKDHLRKSAVCRNENPDYSNFNILRHCKNETYCKFFEAFAIKRLNPTLNKQMFAQGASKFLHVWK